MARLNNFGAVGTASLPIVRGSSQNLQISDLKDLRLTAVIGALSSISPLTVQS